MCWLCWLWRCVLAVELVLVVDVVLVVEVVRVMLVVMVAEGGNCFDY